ncbi:MAG: Unknown protein [uncultured Sulfurovum sp.]|uniref:eCIS core domain-containing protein n=1 Tax=uncultured Sulfurovum sp. TaxID=269237 RepID=A0A6S6TG27_9BACT|nr:MAG: Unknown protein [uncultured Sulfurovum sp.]
MSLDDVKVHYNSKKPAELEALAYAEGTDIYVGPGQEEHLAHEVWHVVQQMGGKVKPTIQLKGEVPVNDDKGLEKEADVMGKKASQLNGKGAEETEETEEEEKKELSKGKKGGKTVQRLKWSEVHTGDVEEISLTESQLPEGVESTEETKDRNVFAGQKKDSSGFLWFEESTLEIQYDIKKMMQYKVMDPSTVFYTAVRDTEMDTIKQNGIDPNYKNEEQPEGSAEYDSKGFNYFGKDKTSEIYGGFIEKGTNWQVISFTLPKGTLIERDPKIPNGLRTTHHIKPGNIIASQSKHY